MANLETLELTINGNAASATQGIDTLTRSLTGLSTVVGNTVTGLENLNRQLSRLKDVSAKIPGIGKAIQKSAKDPKYTPADQGKLLETINNAKKSDLVYTKAQTTLSELMNKAGAGKLSPKQIASQSLQVRNLTEQYENLKNAEEASEAEAQKSGLATALGEIKEGFKKLTAGLDGFFGKVKRIATTMLIRSAIKGLIKSIKEGVNNLYEWSKLNNGAFAQSLDTLHKKTGQLKNSIGAAIAPAISAAIPVIIQLANAAITAFNWVNQLISLLTGKSYWTKAKEGVDNYTEAASGASKANKDWIASFDELEVMTKDTGGGGGGGSSASDYADMFENVTQFDSALRDLADFLMSHFESIKAMAVEIGLAILGWKVSKAFSGLIGTLGGWLATGAIIALTLTAVWALTDQYLDTGKPGWLIASGLTTAIGATGAWLVASKLIGGKAGKYAASFTLILSAVTDIIANVQHTDVDAFSKESILTNVKAALSAGAGVGVLLAATTSLSIPYVLLAAGGAALLTFGIATALKVMTTKNDISVDPNLISLTKEQADEFVRNKMFTIDPKIMIKLVGENVSALQMNSESIEAKVKSMIGTLHVLELGLADTDDYAQLKNDVVGEGGLIDLVSEWISSAEATSKLVLKFTPKLVGETEEEQKQWYINNKEGWEAIQTFMQDIGKQLADEIVEGESGELEVRRPDRVAKLLEEATTISNILAGSDQKTELNIDFELKLKDLDASSLQDALQYYSGYKDEMGKLAEQIQQQAYENQARMVAVFEYMFSLDPNNASIKKKLDEARTGLAEIKANWDKAVNDSVDEMTKPGRDLIMEWMQNQIFTQYDPGSIQFTGEGIIRTRIADTISGFFTDFTKSTEEQIQNALAHAFSLGGIEIPELFVGDFVKLGGWDLLSDDIKTQLFKSLGALSPAVAKLLKDKFGLSANEIFKFGDWNRFTQNEKFNFLNSVKEAFSAQEAMTAARNAGIDIYQLVRDGMASGDENIRKQAEEWNDIIGGELSGTHKINVQENKANTKSVAADINKTIEGIQPVVTASSKFKNGNPKNLQTQVEGLPARVTAKAGFSSGCPKNLQTEVEKLTPNVTSKTKFGTGYPANLKSGIEGLKPFVTSQTKFKSGQPNNLQTAIQGLKPAVSSAAKFLDGYPKNLTTEVEKEKPNIKVTASVDVEKTSAAATTSAIASVRPIITADVKMGSAREAIEDIEDLEPNITATVSASGISNLASAIKNALTTNLTLKTAAGAVVGAVSVLARANGGLVNSGSLFLANENGNAEMIGKFGTHAAVANQEQMVEAMARGVQYANEEQNSLLRRQNELLLGILQKEGTVNFGASTAFGRTVKQSLEMYNAVTA